MTYDAHQREAITVKCLRCGRWWHMTRAARFICNACVRAR